jgi:hypothetical protein
MRFLLLFVLILHGIIHLLGFLKAYQYGEIAALKQFIGPVAGLFWLTAVVLFILTAILLGFQNAYWPFFGMAGVLISQALIILSWSDARYGTIINLALFVIMIPDLVT